MGRGVDRKKLAKWQRRLARYARTNLTAAEFCKRERVSVALLKYWRRQVELAALRSPAPMKPSMLHRDAYCPITCSAVASAQVE